MSLTSNALETGGEIRYEKVGRYQGRSLDFVITLMPGATPDCSGNNDACKAMTAEHYGGLAVRRGAGREIHGKMTLRYTDNNQKAVSARGSNDAARPALCTRATPTPTPAPCAGGSRFLHVLCRHRARRRAH